ncbi:unnamed protein product [Coffea canephora]|uniref:LOB domain-containing protein n=1 Tax=Coffea canephora TaxID=49390 RepID=A0A068U791_COFCA|nr:unnamed protein product [Coffea canephora]
MNSKRCAGCKYLRRRCPSNCILSPHFPPNDPQRFACVHKIYGASNVAKMLQQVPVQQRAEAANAMYYEAYCRIKDPVYGCVGTVALLQQQIFDAECQLAKIQAEIAVLNGHREATHQNQQVKVATSSANFTLESGGEGTFSSTYDPSICQFY